MIRLEEFMNPCPEWDQNIWYGGHFFSGREPSSAYFDARKNGRAHVGIDLAAPFGSPIVAPAPGRVAIKTYNSGAGYWLGLEHETNLGLVGTRHLHIKQDGFRVDVGDWVEQGDLIGLVGSTGASAAPHDHYEMILGGAGWQHWTTGKHLDVEYYTLGIPGRKGEVELTKMIQEILTELGYDPGPIDGIPGAKTKAALKEALGRQGGGSLPSVLNILSGSLMVSPGDGT